MRSRFFPSFFLVLLLVRLEESLKADPKYHLMEFTNIGLASCCRRVKSLQILTPRLQLRGLSGSNWVVAPDLKGFGDSDKPFLARQYKDQVADFDIPSSFFFGPLSKKLSSYSLLFSSTFVKRVVWCRCWWRSSRSSWMCCRSLAVKTFRLRSIVSSGGGEEDNHHWTWSRWPLGLVNIISSIPRTNRITLAEKEICRRFIERYPGSVSKFVSISTPHPRVWLRLG